MTAVTQLLAQGLVEKLLVGTTPAWCALGIALRRHEGADRWVSRVAMVALTALGARAAGDRLAALPQVLEKVDERGLVGVVARGEQQAASVLALALLCASLVGLVHGLRRRSVPTVPLLATSLALPLWCWSRLRDALAMVDPIADLARLPTLYTSLDLALVVGGLGAVTAMLLGRSAAVVPVVVGAAMLLWPASRLAGVLPMEPTLPPQLPPLVHPEALAYRAAGGCLLSPTEEGWDAQPFGRTSPTHHLIGCPDDPTVPHHVVVLAPPELPLAQLVGLSDIPTLHLLTRLADGPARALPWLVTRWSVPRWSAPAYADAGWIFSTSGPRPLGGSVVVDLEPLIFYGPEGTTAGLGAFDRATAHQPRVELLVLPGEYRVEQLVDFCREAMARRPRGARCGLATGDANAWKNWALTAAQR